MPTYTYARTPVETALAPCDVCSQPFEMVQRMADAALEKCPQCGAPVQRVIQAPHLNGVGKFQTPSAGRLANAGFTQYKRKGKGYYEKSFGNGPSSINPGSDN